MLLRDHDDTDRDLIAQATALFRNIGPLQPDAHLAAAAALCDITTDPHLLAHAAVPVLDSYAQVLALAGADLGEAYGLREAGPGASPLAGMADRTNAQHVADKRQP